MPCSLVRISRTRQCVLQLDAGADRVRPIGDVGRGLRALRAGRRAMAEIDAARPALVVHRRNGGVRRPPVPAELVHGLADHRAGAPERLRRHRRVRQRRERIAGQARYAHHAVVLVEERRQRVVVDRPVVGDAVERLHLEIGRMQPRPVRGVHHGRAADAVEVHHLDRRVVVVDRIVLGPAADVRARSTSRHRTSPPNRARCSDIPTASSSRPGRGRGCASWYRPGSTPPRRRTRRRR